MAIDSTRKPTQLVLLDRDGVINSDSAEYIKSADEWRAIPGALDSIARLNQAGIHIAICSNQAGISRGRLSPSDLASIHHRLVRELLAANGHISLWRYCPHHPDHNCACRKPNQAMLEDCMAEFGIAPNAVTFVGDSLKDMQAAVNARCHPILVRTSLLQGDTVRENKLADSARALGVKDIVADLPAAVEQILATNQTLVAMQTGQTSKP